MVSSDGDGGEAKVDGHVAVSGCGEKQGVGVSAGERGEENDDACAAGEVAHLSVTHRQGLVQHSTWAISV